VRATKGAALVATSMFAIGACVPSGPTIVDTSADQAAIHAGDQAHVVPTTGAMSTGSLLCMPTTRC
jgi:hypothetical protein